MPSGPPTSDAANAMSIYIGPDGRRWVQPSDLNGCQRKALLRLARTRQRPIAATAPTQVPTTPTDGTTEAEEPRC